LSSRSPITCLRHPRRYSSPKALAKAPRGEATWEEAVDSFLAEGRRLNLSTATLINYGNYLKGPRLQTFLADHGVTGPADFTAQRLKQLEGELFTAELKPGTVATYHRVLKNFAGFCLREGITAQREILDVAGPKQPSREPETFSPAEERRILAAVKESPRDQMIVRVLLKTGVLLLAELYALTVDDVIDSPDGAYLRVRQGKGRKDRIVRSSQNPVAG
jgi:site-specific recombinase XerD